MIEVLSQFQLCLCEDLVCYSVLVSVASKHVRKNSNITKVLKWMPFLHTVK